MTKYLGVESTKNKHLLKSLYDNLSNKEVDAEVELFKLKIMNELLRINMDVAHLIERLEEA